MDRISKLLGKLTLKESARLKELLVQIQKGDIAALDIKKLKGRNDLFRARKGNMRVIFRISDKNSIFIIALEKRSEKTYKF